MPASTASPSALILAQCSGLSCLARRRDSL